MAPWLNRSYFFLFIYLGMLKRVWFSFVFFLDYWQYRSEGDNIGIKMLFSVNFLHFPGKHGFQSECFITWECYQFGEYHVNRYFLIACQRFILI